MAKFREGQKIRVLDNAFEGTDSPHDIEARGKTGIVDYVLEETLGAGWVGCYEVYIEDLSDSYNLTVDEIEAIE